MKSTVITLIVTVLLLCLMFYVQFYVVVPLAEEGITIHFGDECKEAVSLFEIATSEEIITSMQDVAQPEQVSAKSIPKAAVGPASEEKDVLIQDLNEAILLKKCVHKNKNIVGQPKIEVMAREIIDPKKPSKNNTVENSDKNRVVEKLDHRVKHAIERIFKIKTYGTSQKGGISSGYTDGDPCSSANTGK
ncbi:MAG: hypothetical protein ABI045_04425 [Flavobacteriales bacterium]